MEIGILKDKNCRKLFEYINRRPLCKECQKARLPYSHNDKKRNEKGILSYSNLLPGFSSPKVFIPVDILIIAEAHGGKDKTDFRDQRDLNFEVKKLARYYREKPLQKFHQAMVRELLNILDEEGKTWVFTDLLKCFVWRRGKEGHLNEEKAIEFCRKYLDRQIEALKPRKILVLGKKVAQSYFGMEGKNFKNKHGTIHIKDWKDKSLYLVLSLFPSQMTADNWIEKGGWNPVLKSLLG